MTALVEPEIVQQRATWKPCTPDRATSSTKFTNVKTQFLQWPHLCEHSIFHNIALPRLRIAASGNTTGQRPRQRRRFTHPLAVQLWQLLVRLIGRVSQADDGADNQK